MHSSDIIIISNRFPLIYWWALAAWSPGRVVGYRRTSAYDRNSTQLPHYSPLEIYDFRSVACRRLWKAGLKRSVNASMTRIVFVLKQKHTGVNIALHLRRMARIHTTASRVSHIFECNWCKLVGVLVLMQTDCSDRSVYYSTTRAIVCRLLHMLSKRSRGYQILILNHHLRGAAYSRSHLVLQAYWLTDIDEMILLGIEILYRTPIRFSIPVGIEAIRSVPKKYQTRYPALCISQGPFQYSSSSVNISQ